MGHTTKIQWTEATWNPWHGCKKVSPGCKFCYMFRDKERYGLKPTNVLRSKTAFDKPIKWHEPRLIFTCSWSDFFIEEADEWRNDAWEVIKKTPQHTYQILTKRPERIIDHLPEDWGDGYDNVWLGVSVENNDYRHRIQTLMNIPSKVRFISAEPLIGVLHLAIWNGYIDWVIVGGESGNKTGKYRYRPCQREWIEKIIKEMDKSAVFVKQLGTHLADEMNLKDRHGGNIDEWPSSLQIREMPFTQ